MQSQEANPSIPDPDGAAPPWVPKEFRAALGAAGPIEFHSAEAPPRELLARLAAGAIVILSGPYPRVDAVMRYCQRFARALVSDQEGAHLEDRFQRVAHFAELRRRKLLRLCVLARGDHLVDTPGAPDLAGLQDWLEEPTGDRTYLLPVRRLQRILTDRERALNGLFIPELGGSITLLPHVYTPADQSVPRMFAAYGAEIDGRRVLDMGTGTGVLALLAARQGAAGVVATDVNPRAVRNARLNMERLGLGHIVDVRGPAHLFDAVAGERFDVILFNAPWNPGTPETIYDTATHDPGYRVLDAFLDQAPDHLTSGGLILLQHSDIARRTGGDSLAHLDAALRRRRLRVASRREMSRQSRLAGGQERVYLFEIRSAPPASPSSS